MNFTCTHKTRSRTESWEGTIRIISRKGDCIETEITGRGSCFHVIIGPHAYGHFICIPNYEVGGELASYGDLFWNKERLRRRMGVIDATTVATALKYLQATVS